MWFSKVVIPMIAEICKDPNGDSIATTSTENVEEDPVTILFNGLIDLFLGTSSKSKGAPEQSIIKSDNGKSYVFSTVAMQNILGIILLGADEETEREILEFTGRMEDDKIRLYNKKNPDSPYLVFETLSLGLNNALEEDKCSAQIRNFLCLDLKTIFEESFGEKCNKFYSAINIPVDTNEAEKSLKRVNRVVSEKTNGIFKDILKKFPVDRPLLILNTMTWSGNWTNKFAAQNNCEDFFTVGKKKYKTQFMNLRAPFLIYTNKDFRLLKMSFVGKTKFIDFLILLKNEGDEKSGRTCDFKEKEVYEHFDKKIYYDVKLKIPKFRIETEVNVGNVCKDVGLNSLTGENPNFDCMYEINTLPGANMIHKAIIDLHENGIGVIENNNEEPNLKCETSQSTEFICDRPFYFFIVNDARKSSTTQRFLRKVFHGRYSGPNE